MKKISLTAITISILSPIIVWAQDKGIGAAFPNVEKVAEEGSFNNTVSINSMAGDIIQLALSILGVLFVVFMIHAGYLWLTAAGNEQRVDKAKKIIFESIIGLVIVIAAYAITYFIVEAFKGQVNL
jgi:hypothetical protein